MGGYLRVTVHRSLLSLHKQTDIGYESNGGLMAEEAIQMLQEFYKAGNQRLPVEMRHRKNQKLSEKQL